MTNSNFSNYLNDELTGMPILESALEQSQEWLQQFANRPDFTEKMQQAFGEQVEAATLREIWTSGSFANLPEIEVLPASEINGASGAFAKENNVIYLSQELLTEGNSETITSIFLEEYGHALDKQLNPSETEGDEGELFASFVEGKDLSRQKITNLQSEEDQKTIQLNNHNVEIEQNNGGSETYTIVTPDIKVVQYIDDAVSDRVNELLDTFRNDFDVTSYTEQMFLALNKIDFLSVLQGKIQGLIRTIDPKTPPSPPPNPELPGSPVDRKPGKIPFVDPIGSKDVAAAFGVLGLTKSYNTNPPESFGGSSLETNPTEWEQFVSSKEYRGFTQIPSLEITINASTKEIVDVQSKADQNIYSETGGSFPNIDTDQETNIDISETDSYGFTRTPNRDVEQISINNKGLKEAAQNVNDFIPLVELLKGDFSSSEKRNDSPELTNSFTFQPNSNNESASFLAEQASRLSTESRAFSFIFTRREGPFIFRQPEGEVNFDGSRFELEVPRSVFPTASLYINNKRVETKQQKDLIDFIKKSEKNTFNNKGEGPLAPPANDPLEWSGFRVKNSEGQGLRSNPIPPQSSGNNSNTQFKGPSGAWFQAPFDSSVTYSAINGAEFTEIVNLPTGGNRSGVKPAGGNYTISVQGQQFEVSPESNTFFKAEPEFDFEQKVGEPVSEFTISGISAQTVSNPPSNFKLQLAFNENIASFEQGSDKTQGTDFVTAVDLSGSFDDDLGNIQSAIPGIVQAAEGEISNPEFALASFSSRFSGGYRADVERTTETDKIVDAVKSFSADEDESPRTSLAKAAQGNGLNLRENSERIILLITDEAPTSDERPVSEVRNTLEANNATPIFAVTEDVESDYESLVNSLGRGKVVNITSDSDTLTDAVRLGIAELQGNVTQTGDSSNNNLEGNNKDNTIFGLGGNDTIKLKGGSDTGDGSPGNDQIFGGPGDDDGGTLRGGTGNDTLEGGPGDDRLEGGLDADTMKGGSGADVFAGPPNALDGDTITDFTNQDTIEVSGVQFQQSDLSVESGSAILKPDVNGDGTADAEITLEGLNASANFTVASNGEGDTEITLGEANDEPTVTNQPPVAKDDELSTDEDTAVSSNVLSNDSDANNDSLTVTAVQGKANQVGSEISLESGASLTVEANGNVQYNPVSGEFDFLEQGETLTDEFSYTISDGPTKDSATVAVTIEGVNSAPVAQDDQPGNGFNANPEAFTTDEDTPLTTPNVLANDSDPEGKSLQVVGLDTSNTTGTITDNGDGTFTYTPAEQFDELEPGETETDSFSYTISDGSG
ncbi:MAG: Ig-like domain-containing protein, partial [Halothece sp.]